MDITSYLQRFEGSLRSYTGDDPLEPWGRFVAYLEQKLPGGMSQVLAALVQRFLSEERYANDARYVDYCIRCAGLDSDPAALLAQVNARGVGATSAALYVAWAQQLEQSGRHQEAEAVFQSAARSRAQPADAVLGEHRLFLARTKNQTAASRSSPLQNSLLPNRQRVSGSQAGGLSPAAAPLLQDLVDCPQKAAAYKTTVSRSENSGAAPSSRAVATVSAYLAEQLLCEGAELCFEEARALRYFRRQETEAREKAQKMLSKLNDAILSYRSHLDDLVFPRLQTSPGATATGPEFTQQPSGRLEAEASHHAPHPADESAHPEASAPPVSQGASANLSHLTPDSSLVPATPSRALPSPTVNTREALDVIMDMFQAPTLLEEPLRRPSMLHSSLSDFLPGGSCAAPLTVFQDEPDKENAGAVAPPPLEKSKPIRALAEIPSSNQTNEPPVDPAPDETLWGPRSSSLDSCPNSTKDFNMLAQFVSTPFTHKAPFCFYEGGPGDGEEVDAFLRRQTKKLSPIMELSPSGDAFAQLLPASAAHGTIVGEGVAPPPHGLTCSSITLVEAPPPAALSFRDQTPTCAAVWDVYESPEPAPRREPFTIMEDLDRPASPERVQRPPPLDEPMSPEGGGAHGPEVFPGPRLLAQVAPGVPVSPGRPQHGADVPMSPAPLDAEDEPTMSPEVSLNASRGARGQLVSDPWDQDLISRLLSALSPPLAAHPRCVSWPCKLPAICPKTTISMGRASLRVDCVLGEGAFATVYQATDPQTSERTVLKVQKPANPWEFYVNVQLDARLRPDVRRLFGAVSSAHLFQDGSVLLGELHNHGTLLNAVNIYKTMSDKVMPQPLVMYFAVCILHMVEQLHAVQVVHADIKPDNFLLGDRFLDSRSVGPEDLDHGLVLVDFGQSIDMRLFPEGTAFTATCLTSGFQCTEMLSGKPWSYQTDFFGVAGTVHCLLFGSYMQVKQEAGVWTTNGVFRRNPHSELWHDFFHFLLNAPGGAAPLGLRRLRRSLAAALQQNYGAKLPALKSRMMVLLLENRRAAPRR